MHFEALSMRSIGHQWLVARSGEKFPRCLCMVASPRKESLCFSFSVFVLPGACVFIRQEKKRYAQ